MGKGISSRAARNRSVHGREQSWLLLKPSEVTEEIRLKQ